MHNKEQCGEPLLKRDSACRFHSKNLDAKKEGFNEAFFNKLDRLLLDEKIEVLDFKGYIFPDSITFKKIEFTKEVRFNECTFHGNASFKGCVFRGGITTFKKTVFLGDDTDFSGAGFKAENTLFDQTQFSSKKTNFNSAKFSGTEVSFSNAQFKKGEIDFNNSQFSVEKVILKYARFSASIPGLFESLKSKEKILGFIPVKKDLVDDFKFHLDKTAATQNAVINRKTMDAWYLEDYEVQHPLYHRLWNITSKCGQSLIRWGAWSLGISLLFAIIYYIFFWVDHSSFCIKHLNQCFPPLTFLYYSIVTFTTLGFGDIVPTNDCLQLLVMLEVILGYIMLGGLISIFANKLARRS
jgi:uncharacterized protein YjbI with pentapeptide repeats